MSTDPFLEEDFRVLTPEAFTFVLTNELKRAQRSQNYVSLVLVEPSLQGVAGDPNGDRDQAVRAVARLISRDVRETDLLSHTSMGRLSLVLLDADLDNSARVIDRLMARLDHYDFPRPLTFDVGLATCPTHGCDVESLRRAAESRPVRRRGDRSNAQ
jgi:PleD family two-component response regulator